MVCYAAALVSAPSLFAVVCSSAGDYGKMVPGTRVVVDDRFDAVVEETPPLSPEAAVSKYTGEGNFVSFFAGDLGAIEVGSKIEPRECGSCDDWRPFSLDAMSTRHCGACYFETCESGPVSYVQSHVDVEWKYHVGSSAVWTNLTDLVMRRRDFLFECLDCNGWNASSRVLTLRGLVASCTNASAAVQPSFPAEGFWVATAYSPSEPPARRPSESNSATVPELAAVVAAMAGTAALLVGVALSSSSG